MPKTPAEKALAQAREAYNLMELEQLPVREILYLLVRAVLALAQAHIAREGRG